VFKVKHYTRGVLVDEFLLLYDVSDAVATVIDADLATTWDALMQVDSSKSGEGDRWLRYWARSVPYPR
jgi:hypothetical protein